MDESTDIWVQYPCYKCPKVAREGNASRFALCADVLYVLRTKVDVLRLDFCCPRAIYRLRHARSMNCRSIQAGKEDFVVPETSGLRSAVHPFLYKINNVGPFFRV